MFGSDWPVCLLAARSYEESVQRKRKSALPGLSEAEKALALGENAAQVRWTRRTLRRERPFCVPIVPTLQEDQPSARFLSVEDTVTASFALKELHHVWDNI